MVFCGAPLNLCDNGRKRRSSVLKPHCPGQDTRYWKPADIYEVPCARCGMAVEFFKDDLKRRCPRCGQSNLNPRNDLSCVSWCKTAAECLEELGRPAPETADEAGV
jgi:hypothetical protein